MLSIAEPPQAMELLTSLDAWIALITLTVLEVVLGIDNIFAGENARLTRPLYTGLPLQPCFFTAQCFFDYSRK